MTYNDQSGKRILKQHETLYSECLFDQIYGEKRLTSPLETAEQIPKKIGGGGTQISLFIFI